MLSLLTTILSKSQAIGIFNAFTSDNNLFPKVNAHYKHELGFIRGFSNTVHVVIMTI